MIVLYTFYEEYLEDAAELFSKIEHLEFEPDVKINTTLRGKVSHNKKNRTGVKV